MKDSLTIVIGGEAGQGLATIGDILAKLLVKTKFDFITYQGYHSRIRGGHNTYCFKISQTALMEGPEEKADIVLALNKETELIDASRLRKGGLLLGLSKKQPEMPEGANYITIPYDELSSVRNRNFVAVGILASALGLDQKIALERIEASKLLNAEIENSFIKAYEWGKTKLAAEYHLKSLSQKTKRMLMNGNEAIAFGAACGGVNFCSFYPMSPGTSVALAFASIAKDVGLEVEQAEDEIAAINMAIGASFAGAPTLVTTSGGGFALMGEGISLSAMTETPVVVSVIQRPGPATGLPTRTEQADLDLVLYAGHGEFPRAIFAPSNVEECFELSRHAVHIAEHSQGPVFILSDQYLSDSLRPIHHIDIEKLPKPVDPLEIHQKNLSQVDKKDVYQRYQASSCGVSPRLLPGFSEHLVKVDSDEHDHYGQLTEDLDIRIEMQNKRMKKEEYLKANLIAPCYHGDDEPQLLLISWGSTKGATWEATEKLRSEGKKVGMLHFNQLYPIDPEPWLSRLQKAKKVVFIESNFNGQFACLITRITGFNHYAKVLRYDGLPMTADYIIERL